MDWCILPGHWPRSLHNSAIPRPMQITTLGVVNAFSGTDLCKWKCSIQNGIRCFNCNRDKNWPTRVCLAASSSSTFICWKVLLLFTAWYTIAKTAESPGCNVFDPWLIVEMKKLCCMGVVRSAAGLVSRRRYSISIFWPACLYWWIPISHCHRLRWRKEIGYGPTELFFRAPLYCLPAWYLLPDAYRFLWQVSLYWRIIGATSHQAVVNQYPREIIVGYIVHHTGNRAYRQ